MSFGKDIEDPRCPECGGPIAASATQCLHCSADLADNPPVPAGEVPDQTAIPPSADTVTNTVSTASGTPVDHPLDPEGVMDNTLTVIVGILGGGFIGAVGTTVLLLLTQNLWGVLFGFAAWLGSTSYLVRRRYLMDAVAKTAYGSAITLLLVPVVAFVFETGFLARGGIFIALLVFVAMPAAIAAGVGWFASRYVPEDASVG